MGVDGHTGDSLIGEAQAFNEVAADSYKNQRQQGFTVVLAFVQAFGAGFVAPHICPDQARHKEQTNDIEDGFVSAIKITHQDFADIGAHQGNGEVFFDGDDVSADKQTKEAEENQGMHHARAAILERLFLAQ